MRKKLLAILILSTLIFISNTNVSADEDDIQFCILETPIFYIDINESDQWNDTIGFPPDCPGSNYMYGVDPSDNTWKCRTDEGGAASGDNWTFNTPIYNVSDDVYLNMSFMNETMDQRDTDTTYSHLSNFTDDLGHVEDNTSWNETWADTQYLSIDYTHLGNFTDDLGHTEDNTSWNQSLANTLYADISVTGDNTSWNESWATTLYLSIYYTHLSNFTDDLGHVEDNTSWNETWADTQYLSIDYTHLGNFTDDLNHVEDNTSWNETWADTKYSSITEPLWSANYTLHNDSWSTTYNSTYDAYNSTGLIVNWSNLITPDNVSWNESMARGIFQEDIGSDCGAGNYTYGVDNDGTLKCREDQDSGGAGASKWVDAGDYIYPNGSFANNTVIFGYINASDWSNFTGTESQITDLSHTTDTNASTACSDNEVHLGDDSCYDLGYVQNSTNTTNSTIYAQLSDLNDQVFASANVKQPINLSNEDEIFGLVHSTTVNSSEITIVTSAVYAIMAQPQVAAGAGKSGNFHMWLEKYNTTDWINVSNSNVELSLGSLDEDVIPLIAVLSLDETEKVRLMGSVTDTGITLDTIVPSGEPVIPSIIFSMFVVGPVNYTDTDTTYSHLSNFTDDLGHVEDNTSWNQSWATTLYLSIDYTHLGNFTDDLNHVEDNTSWNESWATTLYLSIYYTHLSNFTDDLGHVEDNTSWNETWADTQYLSIDYTHLTNFTDDLGHTEDNTSWNQSLANTLYADISVTGDNTSWNESWATTLYLSIYYTHLSNFTDDLGHVEDNTSWNETWADTKYSSITEPLWSANYTLHNDSWSTTYNSTYDALISDNTSWNETWADTQYLSIDYTHLGNFTDDLGHTEDNTSWNETLADSKYIINNTGGYVITKLCFDAGCTTFANATGYYMNGGSAWIVYNGTGILIHGG